MNYYELNCLNLMKLSGSGLRDRRLAVIKSCNGLPGIRFSTGMHVGGIVKAMAGNEERVFPLTYLFGISYCIKVLIIIIFTSRYLAHIGISADPILDRDRIVIGSATFY